MTFGTSPDLKHGHILVVDDNEQNRKLIALQLRRAGYTAVLVEDGEQALEAVAAEPPDLILLDLQMPGMDGFAVCAEVRTGERSRGIPIVILTASQEQTDKRRALDVGADDFLTKPIDETDLLARVRSLLRVKGLYDELAQRGDQIAHQAEELATSNAELVKLAGELEERVAERTSELEARNEEIRVMSQQLWQTAKLATMGELAASVAHELNNPLATVSLRVESLLAQVPADDPKHRALEIVGNEADRMARLVSRLLEYSRRSGQQISTLDVREEVEKTLDLVDYHLRNRGIAVVREFAPQV
ncbi:MAG: hybrid sensor histidine kinase/response regulator, partial [Chloroflexi bacterium]|nr:hybrid sensor histidine kinase/response regulator [Chloroflexota bacterium]